MVTVGELYSFSEEFIENIRLKLVDPVGNPVEGVSGVLSYDSEVVNFTSDASGYSEWVFIPVLNGKTVTVDIPESEDYAAFNASPTILFDSGEYEVELTQPTCVRSQSENMLNFFHWHVAQSILLGDLSAETLVQCSTDSLEFLPNIFAENDENCFYPLLLEGEEFCTQLNFDIQADTSNWVLAVVQNYSILLDNAATLEEYVAGLDKKLYFSLTPDAALVGQGLNFIIYDSVTQALVYVSNSFEVLSKSINYRDFSVRLEYSNSTNLDNFEYVALPTFTNKLRLQLNNIDYDYEYELKNSKEESTGVIRPQKIQKSKFVKLEAYFFDQFADDAMSSLSDHDNVYINGDKVNLKSGFATAVNRDMQVNKGSIEYYIEKYSTVNRKR